MTGSARQQASEEEQRRTQSPSSEPEIERAPLASLPRGRLRAMLKAAAEVVECERVLQKGGLNIVGEVLRGQGTFYEYNHYPENDVYDSDTRSQYYYHAHRGTTGEHGHFHTFFREPESGAVQDVTPRGGPESGCSTDDRAVHLIGISMNAEGWPIGLFATNHWVTGGLWRNAAATLRALPRFKIDHAYPSWPVNQWIGAMLVLFRPQIEALIRHRDAVIAAHSRKHPDGNTLEDRSLEVTGELPVDVEAWISELQRYAASRKSAD